ncbi:hypothetical protein Dsin_012198 [Dipteronia sinensis]|uniref:Uncharacterized protein n=1 Tax=Dipteronia sinensis TaxID=43782 RepID=A0AAE0E7Q5_9ROSI|nr:hypothetical protein Dsin_012198 [Dipteronia sinensis]
MWKLKQLMPGGDEEREESFLEEEESDGLCSLCYTQRMYAFAACLVAGLACMFLVGILGNAADFYEDGPSSNTLDNNIVRRQMMIAVDMRCGGFMMAKMVF